MVRDKSDSKKKKNIITIVKQTKKHNRKVNYWPEINREMI